MVRVAGIHHSLAVTIRISGHIALPIDIGSSVYLHSLCIPIRSRMLDCFLTLASISSAQRIGAKRLEKDDRHPVARWPTNDRIISCTQTIFAGVTN